MFQGWVSILSCLLVVVSPWNGERRRGGGSGGVAAEPQLWGPEPWEPERRAKSLGFLGKEEAALRDIETNSVAGGAGEDEDKDEDAGTKKVVLQKRSIRRFVITEKAPTRAFSWLKAAATTFKTLLRHYAERTLTPW